MGILRQMFNITGIEDTFLYNMKAKARKEKVPAKAKENLFIQMQAQRQLQKESY